MADAVVLLQNTLSQWCLERNMPDSLVLNPFSALPESLSDDIFLLM